MKKMIVRAAAVLAVLTAFPAWGQIWDNTGNRLLTGTFYFRDVAYAPTLDGAIVQKVMTTGTLVFNGNGTYSGTIAVLDSASGGGNANISGRSYTVAASGHGFMQHPYFSNTIVHFVYTDAGNTGQISNVSNVLVGSATEGALNDLFVAIPATPQPTLQTFSGGQYSLAYLSDPSGYSTNTYNSLATLSPNGAGQIGSVPVKTYVGNDLNPRNTTETGVSYTVVNGKGTLKFPTTAQLPLRGDKDMFITADGNFIFGGSLTGFDFFVGVKRAAGTAPPLNGLFYQAGLNHIFFASEGVGTFDTFYGSFKAVNGKIYDHQRFLSTTQPQPIDYTAIGFYPNSATNDYTDDLSAVEYVVGREGTIRIGIGQSPYMSLRVAVKGPVFKAPSTAPYIDPTGVVNSASYAPFTAGIARGELLAIFGENLSDVTVAAQGGQVFPKTMGGVKVLMNNVEAAIYFVSPGLVSAIVPYGINTSVIQIQIMKESLASNVVTAFRHTTAPGIFSLDISGSGHGAILDTAYRIVNDSNPTQPGAALQMFGTGLGDVFPVIPDGGLGPGGNGQEPATTLPSTQVGSRIDLLDARILFSGLTPTVAGLYQVNAVVPDDTSLGSPFVDIYTIDAYTSQVTTRVGSGASAPAVRNAKGERLIPRRR